MKILITGCSGQLAREIILQAPEDVEIIKANRDSINLNNLKECKNAIEKYKPKWLINCAAYTNVDKAETDYENALKVNSLAPREFAIQLKKTGGKMLHLSTDFVFDGNQKTPYKTSQDCNPINKYGITKLKGEKYIEDILFKTNQAIILRTSWLMGITGKNFALTILDLIKNNKSLRVVSDQYSSPTSTKTLSNACWELLKKYEIEITKEKNLPHIFHWSDSGIASWYDVAVAIQEIGLSNNLIKNYCEIFPISSSEFPRPAKRPTFSALDCNSTSKFIGIKQINWRKALEDSLKRIKSNQN